MKSQPIDALIIGAGPCGIFQAFQLGLQGISSHIVESHFTVGGQCNELYVDKPIYDIPGIPHILAGDLAQTLLTQIKPFDTTFHFNTALTRLDQNADSTFTVKTADATEFHARHIIVASGAGAFSPVKMRLDGIEAFEDSQLFYTDIEVSRIADQAIVVTGDTVAALEAVVKYHHEASRTVYIHRKRRLPDHPELTATLSELDRQGHVTVIQGKVTEGLTQQNKLSGLRVTTNTKEKITIGLDMLIARLGNSPKAQNYSHWGLHTIRNHINVNPGTCESELAGLYAVGDINHYPGKRKLILCGFHEATLAAFAIAAKLNPQTPIHTQYTTTSTQLLKRLGVL